MISRICIVEKISSELRSSAKFVSSRASKESNLNFTQYFIDIKNSWLILFTSVMIESFSVNFG